MGDQVSACGSGADAESVGTDAITGDGARSCSTDASDAGHNALGVRAVPLPTSGTPQADGSATVTAQPNSPGSSSTNR